MFDGIEYRGYGQEIVEELAKYAGVPVWNGLTNEFHPTQMIADMLTIREHLGKLKGVKFVYMGDARYNMGNSLMVTCAKLGMDFVACTNKKYFPNDELVKYCKDVAEKPAHQSHSQRMWQRAQRTQMSSTQMCGYQWENRKRYGQSELTT